MNWWYRMGQDLHRAHPVLRGPAGVLRRARRRSGADPLGPRVPPHGRRYLTGAQGVGAPAAVARGHVGA
ncbi:hypothetical protein [Deinococcus yunweiensis]|uniref:hypothetical protein n=1 Tax=Deinococcus yunweiensis TaxID=367282 RepID=UPI00398F0DA6